MSLFEKPPRLSSGKIEENHVRLSGVRFQNSRCPVCQAALLPHPFCFRYCCVCVYVCACVCVCVCVCVWKKAPWLCSWHLGYWGQWRPMNEIGAQTARRCVRAPYRQHPDLVTKQSNPDYRHTTTWAGRYPFNMLSVSLTNVSRMIHITQHTHMTCHSWRLHTDFYLDISSLIRSNSAWRITQYIVQVRRAEVRFSAKPNTHHISETHRPAAEGRPAVQPPIQRLPWAWSYF